MLLEEADLGGVGLDTGGHDIQHPVEKPPAPPLKEALKLLLDG